MRSTDGRNWKALSKFGSYHLTTIAWDGTKYVMFGSNTEYEREANYASSEAFASTDGLQWKKIAFEPGEAIHYLTWGKNNFVAVGREHVFTSVTGRIGPRPSRLGLSMARIRLNILTITILLLSGMRFLFPPKYPFEINGNEVMKDGVKAHGKYIFVGAYGQMMYNNALKF
ncbi:hypothetical protein M2105_001129 [Paenibacillus sp. PastF-1]|nr:hypothetical protein [Paenibacillus sp. PastF-2]MDF9846363.1 hypothetical protein [Paenibacillus sp. PastM-2]MDF9853287.1 hypothetical protein [Paenibacillus sp. PastF-1]